VQQNKNVKRTTSKAIWSSLNEITMVPSGEYGTPPVPTPIYTTAEQASRSGQIFKDDVKTVFLELGYLLHVRLHLINI
jgi:hypothetical protein